MNNKTPKNIGLFKLYTKKPNTISKGSLYIADLPINTQNADKIRKIRVYLPSCYDFDNSEEKYDVLYMLDGKNCFDDHTSFVGEWHADEWLEKDVKENKRSYIIVAIDAPKTDKDRTEEMLPYKVDTILSRYVPKGYKGYADNLCDFIINELENIIRNNFHVNDEKRAIMGSSMGGIFSFYAALRNPKFYSCCLSFSTALFLYRSQHVKNKFNAYLSSNPKLPNVFLYCGAGDKFEGAFEPLNYYVYRKLKNKTNVVYVLDSKEIHHEKAWSKYYNHAIDFWFENK